MAFQGIREKMNQDQKPFIIGGIVMVCVALSLLVWELKPVSAPPAPSSYYFYDTSNGSITTEPATAIPPLKAAGGKDTLVRAFLFTCSTCGDKKVGYLMKYSAQAKAAKKHLANPPSNTMTPQQAMQYNAGLSQYRMAVANGTLVRLPAKGAQWYPLAGPVGSNIATPPHCSAKTLAKPCLP